MLILGFNCRYETLQLFCRFISRDALHGQLYTMIQQKPEVFTLLIELIQSASASPRHGLIFNPLPPDTDISLVARLLAEVPKLEDLKGCSSEKRIKLSMGGR